MGLSTATVLEVVCFWCVWRVLSEVVWGNHNRSNTVKKIQFVAAISVFCSTSPGL